MNADIDHSRSSRRPRPEVAVYRPGSGPLKKSSSNVENIQPGSSLQGTGRTDIDTGLESSFRNVNLNDESKKSKDRGGEVHTQESKSRRTNIQRQDRNADKPRSENHHQQHTNKKKEEFKEPPVPSNQGKRQLYYQDNVDTGSNQDLRQLLLEKRQQRSNESPSTGHPESSPTPNQPSNGKQKNDNRQERQPAKPKEEVRTSQPTNPFPPNNVSKSASIDSSLLSRQSDKRSSGRRRNDRKPRVENSFSDGHLASLTNNNSSAAATKPPSSKTLEEPTSGSKNDSERSKNNSKDKRDGK